MTTYRLNTEKNGIEITFTEKPKKEKTTTWKTPGGIEYYNISNAALTAEHTLIAGSTGCGKSTFLRSILHALLAQHSPATAEIVIIDPKMTDLWRYEKLPHCKAYITDRQTAADYLTGIYQTIITRQAEARRKGQDDYTGAHLYILIDELNPLINSASGKQTAKALEDIATLGRSARVHLIACTQNPNRKTIPGNIADNCTVRFALKCQTRYQSSAIIGQGGAENLPKHGETLADINGDFGHYKVPFVQMEDVQPLIDYWTSANCKITLWR